MSCIANSLGDFHHHPAGRLMDPPLEFSVETPSFLSADQVLSDHSPWMRRNGQRGRSPCLRPGSLPTRCICNDQDFDDLTFSGQRLESDEQTSAGGEGRQVADRWAPKLAGWSCSGVDGHPVCQLVIGQSDGALSLSRMFFRLTLASNRALNGAMTETTQTSRRRTISTAEVLERASGDCSHGVDFEAGQVEPGNAGAYTYVVWRGRRRWFVAFPDYFVTLSVSPYVDADWLVDKAWAQGVRLSIPDAEVMAKITQAAIGRILARL